jgi:hypothetical protein
MDPSLYLVETFTPHLHTTFDVEVEPGASLPLELVEVERGPAHPRALMFWLLFRGPGAPQLSQRIYHLRHPVLGGLDLFLVPVGNDPQGTNYQVVFNRMINDAPSRP